MSSDGFRCPNCDALLRGSPATGQRVRCGRCGTAFRRQESPASFAAPAEPSRPRAPAEGRDAELGIPPEVLAKKVKGNNGLILGLSVGGGVGLLAVAAVIALWAFVGRGASPAAPTPPAPATQILPTAAAAEESLSPAAVQNVKRATVRVRAQTLNGTIIGSGFFEAASGHVLTNAHLLGMEVPNRPPPLHIEVVQSGAMGEAALPAQIVVVDRFYDLALLRVDFAAAGLNGPPAALPVGADGPREKDQVFVFGFPADDDGREPTLSPCAVSGLDKDKDGLVTAVRILGGAAAGDSGGPVVDRRGTVVGVAQARVAGFPIDSAVPADAARSDLNGRCSEMRVGDADRNGDRIVAPVDVSVIDPLRRITEFSVEWWAGDPGGAVPASESPPPAAPARQSAPVTLRLDGGSGHAEIVLDPAPPPGKVLWVQPTFVNGDGRRHWGAGQAVPLEPPVEPKAATLTRRPQAGALALTLKSTATTRFQGADGDTHSLYRNIETQLAESADEADAQGVSRVALAIERFALGQSIDGKGATITPQFKRAIQNVPRMGLSLTTDGQGSVTGRAVDLDRAPEDVRLPLRPLGEQILLTLDFAAVPIPGGEVRPGQTWSATRDAPIDPVETFQTAAADVTYTYRGVHTVGGRELAVVDFSGAVRPTKDKAGGAAGTINGTAAIDVAAGVVVKVRAAAEVTAEAPFRGVTSGVGGTLEVKLTRSVPPQ